MRATFVDTAYFVALIDPRDALHDRAVDLARALAKRGAPLATSDAVLIEVASYFARGPLRAHAIEWIVRVRAAAGWEIAPMTRALVTRGETLYRAHADESWSATDCTSMEIMRDLDIRDVATTDRGFAQAGFRILLAPTG
jgi:predicted nucleic acid-binding protein